MTSVSTGAITPSPITPLTFTGTSTYASDFQSVLNRAVSIASMPIEQDQAQQTVLSSKQQLLTGLSSAVATLAQDVTALGQLGSSGAQAATSSDPSLVTAATTGSVTGSEYTISDITSVAAAASETSLSGYANSTTTPIAAQDSTSGFADATSTPVSTTGTMSLVVGSKSYTLDVSQNNNLDGVREAINAAGVGVTASVKTGTNGQSYLSVMAGTLTTAPVQLIDDPTGAANNILAAPTMNLTVGSRNYTLDLSTNNSLSGLSDAINAAGSGVTATVLTTGSGSDSDYLSVSANSTGATTLQLTNEPNVANTDILTSTNQGSDAKFDLNGVPIDQPSNTINDVVPGLTFNILGTTAANQSVTLSMASDPTQLSSALQTLVSDYNAVVNLTDAQTGAAGGVLTGDPAIYDTQAAMRQLAGYYQPPTQSGGVCCLADLGITLDTTGQMSFDQDTFNALSSSQITSAFQMLGSSTTGLGALANNFTAISDPVSGECQSEEAQCTNTNNNLTTQVATLTTQVNNMQTTLIAKLNSADELIASLQSQENMLSSSIEALDYTAYGKPLNE
jgi:flagellar hook-associated protein 2